MADLRRLVTAATTAVCVLGLAGCAGVPEAGDVHKVQPHDVVVAQGPVRLSAQGPQPDSTPSQLVTDLIVAMATGDVQVVQEFLTDAYLPRWQATVNDQTMVFSSSPSKPVQSKANRDTYSVQFNGSGVIDGSGSYRRSNAVASVNFTLAQQRGEWRVDSISQPGIFVPAAQLPDVLTPEHLYFPSHRYSTAGVPRLVPDTVFLPADPDNQALQVIGQLLGGPTSWMLPGVYVAAPTSTSVSTIQSDPTSGLTTINLSADVALLSTSRLETLKAQIAYTLADQGKTGPIQLEVSGVALQQPFSLSHLDPGYDPDGGSAQSPLYYVSAADTLVKRTRSSEPGTSDGSVPVLDHVDGVGQIAVGPLTDDGGTATQSVAGTRSVGGVTTLSVASLGVNSADPWTDIAFPGVTHLSTPSFDVDGTAVWIVATSSRGTQLYRVPVGGGTPGRPVAVTAFDSSGSPVRNITAFRVSPDGARAALIHDGQAAVGVVDQTAHGWTIDGLRPVITVDPRTADVEIYWADRFNLGVVAQPRVGGTTTLYTVSADGYTDTPEGAVDRTTVALTPPGATQFAHAPNQLWVASAGSQLTRQQAPDVTTTNDEADLRPWDHLGAGTWPTYSD